MPLTDSNDVSARIGFPGQVAQEDLTNVTTKLADGDVTYGVFVSVGANPGEVKAFDTTSEAVVGISALALSAVERSTTSGQDAAGNPLYPDNTLAGVCDFGIVTMLCDGAAVEGGAVYARHDATGAGEVQGQASALDDADTDLVPNAVFASDASGGVAKVRIRLT